ncbi:hypothetical protein U27_07091 [Candidatus Vecturithrix granuli]|uniref:HTH cro/C1-type domain-containing protein n=1 Tax=Vecturithrix granuli TaxID=1499967 RepID=A0A081C698_VECG1|nr:hypothetical protein U27_07091 [Candidatus Vecturithrix granuli]
MSEFARVLSEIIEHAKQEKVFSLKELAQEAHITSSYLSSLKQSNRKPPAHKTLLKLTDALRQFNVSELDVQRLIDVYNRQHLNYQEERSGLLASLIDEFKEEGNLFERLKHGVQTRGLVLKDQKAQPEDLESNRLHADFVEGDHHAFIVNAIKLLKKAQKSSCKGRRIFITWFHHDLLEDNFNRDREELRDILRSFLWVDSPFQILHLWAGDIAKEITVILDFLVQYIGTSNCFLYEIPYGQHLSEYLVIEDVGFIEARPVLDNRYWIRTVLVDAAQPGQAAELAIVIQYLEYLLGPQDIRKPLVQTNASPGKFSVTPGLQKLIDVEKCNLKTEELLIKSSFSGRYRPVELIRLLLEVSGVSDEMIETFVTQHQERVLVLEKRIESGKDRSIHERGFLKKEFQQIFRNLALTSLTSQSNVLEAELLKKQIIGMLRALKRNPNFHFALADQEYLIRMTVSGDTAFLSFDPPGAQYEPPFKRDDLLVRAWTDHPDVVYQLRHEFHARWKAIDPRWRTDNENGRQNVVDFLVAEPLKALLDANVAEQHLCPFMCELIDQASYLDTEAFIREVYTHEQVAQEIFMLSHHLPLMTIPPDIAPWDPRSSMRTRQILFQALLQDITRIRLIIPQNVCEEYWETGQYKTYTFHREWIRQHFRYLHDLLLKYPGKMTVELIQQPEIGPVNVEVMNGEWVILEKTVMAGDCGGIILHDKQLAEKLMAYIDRNLLATCPPQFKDSANLITWLEELTIDN